MLKCFTIIVLDEPLGKVASNSLDHSIAIKFALTAGPTEEPVVMSVTRITLSKANEMEVPPQIVGDTVDPSADVLVEEPALEKTWKFLL